MKVGDKVVCIKKGGKWECSEGSIAPSNFPKYNEIYTIDCVMKDEDGVVYLGFKEFGWNDLFVSLNFRKVKPAFRSSQASRELANRPIVREIVEKPKKEEYHVIEN